MKLDVSKFQKIDEDHKHAVLKHPNGHEIKVAKKGLSSEMLKELEGLPLNKAKGGKISYKEFSKNYEASKASKPAESSNTMPGSPTDAKNNYTEPQDIGTKGYTDKGNYNDVALAALKREAPPFGPLGTKPTQHYPPCINPSCKSYGKPHPNCRCYGGVSEHTGVGEAGHFAEGGKVGESHYCSEDRPHDPSCEYYADGGGVMSAPSPVQTLEQEQPQMNTNVETQAAPTSTQQPQNPMEQAPVNPPLNPTATNALDIVHHLSKEDAAHQADADRGHINPKTYHDLFESKSLPGKIGTIFGLMVGGAGAGLAHQDSALLNMMTNELQRDLEAQKQSAANRQNFYTLAQNDLKNQADVKLTDAQRQALADPLAMMRQNRSALQILTDMTNKMPPGDTKNKAMMTIAMLKPQVDAGNFGIAQKAGVNAATLGAMAPEGGGSEEQFKQQQQMRKAGYLGPEQRELGQDVETKHIPGVPGLASRPVAPEDQRQVKDMNVLSDKAKDLIDFAQKHVGTLNPSNKATAKQKAEELINFYNASLGGTLGEGRLDWLQKQIKTNPTGIIPYLLGNQATLKEILKSNDNRKNILLKSYGFQSAGGTKAPEGPAKSKSGKHMEMGPNGKMVYR